MSRANQRSTLLHPAQAPMPAFNRALAATKAGSARTIIMCCGDSTTGGIGAGEGSTTYTNARAHSYPYQLAAYFEADGYTVTKDAVWGMTRGNPTDIDAYQQFNALVTVAPGSGWVQGTGSLGGLTFKNETDTTPLVWSSPTAFDRFTAYYITNTTPFPQGVLNIAIDGGAPTVVNLDQARSVRQTTVSTSLGVHTVSLSRASGGPVHLIGWEAYNSAAPDVAIWNMGWGGSTLVEWVTDSQANYGPLDAMRTISPTPHLIINNHGINHWSEFPGGPNFYQRYQLLIANQFAMGADIVMEMPTPSNPAVASLAMQDSYFPVIKSLASANRLRFYNITELEKDWTTANAAGHYNDNRHPNAAGYANQIPGLYALLTGRRLSLS